jgi:hypothetical protein
MRMGSRLVSTVTLRAGEVKPSAPGQKAWACWPTPAQLRTNLHVTREKSSWLQPRLYCYGTTIPVCSLLSSGRVSCLYFLWYQSFAALPGRRCLRSFSSVCPMNRLPGPLSFATMEPGLGNSVNCRRSVVAQAILQHALSLRLLLVRGLPCIETLHPYTSPKSDESKMATRSCVFVVSIT